MYRKYILFSINVFPMYIYTHNHLEELHGRIFSARYVVTFGLDQLYWLYKHNISFDTEMLRSLIHKKCRPVGPAADILNRLWDSQNGLDFKRRNLVCEAFLPVSSFCSLLITVNEIFKITPISVFCKVIYFLV